MSYLISGQNTSGSGNGAIQGVHWSDMGYAMLEVSGNSASAALWGNVSDEARCWMKVTAWAQGPNTTATAQITGTFFKVMATVDWASGGTNTGKVYLQYSPRRLSM